MAFLFKSKKSQDRALSSRDGSGGGTQESTSLAGTRIPRDAEKHQRGTPTGSLNSIDHGSAVNSPEHGRRGGSIDQTIQPPSSDLALRNGPPTQSPNASLYPWSQRRLTYTTNHPSPFPRYGAAVNAASSKEGDIYLMGGLINSSTVKGDLWMIEAGGSMSCYPLATTAEGPGPRVGHASLLVGNAFIVYGGDTKIDDSDVLDETLYLLNTSTRHWSRALPAGPRPSGRYGHSLNILGSKIYIFGGQIEGFFMNDLAAFDLNQLQMANNRWEILIKSDNTGKLPAARTNHTVVTYNDKMYLFGGTNGFQWFNDVWCYDPAVNKWSQLDCIGYIPSPREGHAAALVDDVMYIFGGRTEEGTDLGDLAAFRISLRRWYTFQNMGPSPSPRSGHSMTTVGKSIVVLGGEPSSASSTINDLGILYVLDTIKIRYPVDGQQNTQRALQGRRPSNSDSNTQLQNPRDSPVPAQEPRRLVTSPPPNAGPVVAMTGPRHTSDAPAMNGSPVHSHSDEIQTSNPDAKMQRAATGPAGPPPQGPTPPKPSAEFPAIGRVRGASADRSVTSNASASPQIGSSQSPVIREIVSVETEPTAVNGDRAPFQQIVRTGSKQDSTASDKMKQPRQGLTLSNSDGAVEPAARAAPVRPSSPPPPTRQPSNPLSRRSSGRNSQTVALLKELDAARNRNAWYASELELARKAGYTANTSSSPVLDVKTTEAFDDEDRPLIEALLHVRTELANVQSAVDKQAVVAARQISEAERQRDAAIQEAVYAKAKLAAQAGSSAPATPQFDGDQEDISNRLDGMGRKLASALNTQRELNSQLETTKAELAAERKARNLVNETASVAEKRMSELEAYKQQAFTELERLRSELHLSQREAREHSVSSADAVATLALLKVEKEELERRYEAAVGGSKNHEDTFESLRVALQASEDAKSHLETKLAAERSQKEKLETKFNKLKMEHEACTAELVASTQRLRDAEEISEKHAHEAKTHRQALLSGLDKISTKDVSKASTVDSGKVVALQNQVATANGLVKKYQQELDVAADKLRSAEERIAGLEQYQEQSSRDGVSVRRQLQTALREAQSLQAAHTDMKNQLAAQQLETNAMSVQHTALKDILTERGTSPTAVIRSRNLASPRTLSPEQNRLRDLETQLATAHSAHEETRQAFTLQAQESESAYREKLSQLESDYQSAVHYVKGTEKMLKQLKDQLSRYKSENGRLKAEVEELEERMQSDNQKRSAPSSWESERSELQRKVETLQTELKSAGSTLETKLDGLRNELSESVRRRDLAIKGTEEASQKLGAQRKDLEQLRSENALLEQRATDAEQKVALLLDQVEHSVDNYRRRSRQVFGLAHEGTNGGSLGHTRNESSEAENVYATNASDARNSVALDNLASELETLRTHWEATNKNYRLSTNFDFDPPVDGPKDDDGKASSGLSESLADWRKKLDAEEHGTDGGRGK